MGHGIPAASAKLRALAFRLGDRWYGTDHERLTRLGVLAHRVTVSPPLPSALVASDAHAASASQASQTGRP